jgi:hypothetical protein
MLQIELIQQEKHRENAFILILNTIGHIVLIYYSIEIFVSASELFSWIFCCCSKTFSSLMSNN